MYRLVVLYGPPADADHFRDHYRDVHLPLVRAIPGVSNISYSHGVDALGGPSPYYSVFQADFDSADAFAAGMDSPEGQLAAADIPNYASGGATILHFTAHPG
ncbi:EthD family reductase [Mycolicibacter minnesotensis]